MMELESKIACPLCKGILQSRSESLYCVHCEVDYPIVDNIPNLLPPNDKVEGYDYGWYDVSYFTVAPYSPYCATGSESAIADDRYKVFKNHVYPDSLLDVGCAYGLVVQRCLKDGIFAVGMDTSQWCGLQGLIDGHYVRGTAWALPFKDKSFDVLYCDGVLEHLPEHLIGKVMSEFYRVSERRYLAPTYCADADHHLCIKDFNWWLERCPPNTWLAKESNSFEGNSFAYSEGGEEWTNKKRSGKG